MLARNARALLARQQDRNAAIVWRRKSRTAATSLQSFGRPATESHLRYACAADRKRAPRTALHAEMDAMPPPPTDPAAEALQLASTEIPEALDELGRKHDYVNDVVQWCESSYQSGDKNLVLKQTKEYLVDALEVVAKEVETTSAKLIRFLSLQNDAVEGLGLELDAVRERLALAKAQNAAKRMEALCPERKREPSKPRLEVLDDASREKHMCTVGNYESSLQKRLSGFDAVGSKL